MEQPGDGREAATGEDRAVDHGAGHGVGEVERYAPAVRAYLTDVCGADAADRLAPEVLARLAVAGAVEDPIPVIASATRWAGLGWLRQNTGRIGLPRGGTRCRSVPDLLGERSEGRIQTVGLDRLYNHLSACGECAATASRYDAAEWVLRRDLLLAFPRGGEDEPAAPETPLEPTSVTIATPEGSAEPTYEPDQPPLEAPSGPSAELGADAGLERAALAARLAVEADRARSEQAAEAAAAERTQALSLAEEAVAAPEALTTALAEEAAAAREALAAELAAESERAEAERAAELDRAYARARAELEAELATAAEEARAAQAAELDRRAALVRAAQAAELAVAAQAAARAQAAALAEIAAAARRAQAAELAAAVAAAESALAAELAATAEAGRTVQEAEATRSAELAAAALDAELARAAEEARIEHEAALADLAAAARAEAAAEQAQADREAGRAPAGEGRRGGLLGRRMRRS